MLTLKLFHFHRRVWQEIREILGEMSEQTLTDKDRAITRQGGRRNSLSLSLSGHWVQDWQVLLKLMPVVEMPALDTDDDDDAEAEETSKVPHKGKNDYCNGSSLNR